MTGEEVDQEIVEKKDIDPEADQKTGLARDLGMQNSKKNPLKKSKLFFLFLQFF